MKLNSKLISHLETSNIRENTVVIFVGDNGPNGVRYNGGLKVIKSHVDEGGLRVPCLISYPAKDWNTGKNINQLTAHIDILPTIAGLFEEEKATFDGVNIETLINGEVLKRPFFTHQVVRKFDRYPGAVREGDYLLTIKNGNNELYDLAIDQGQNYDLSDSLTGLTKMLRDKYETWISASIDQLGNPELVEIGHEQSPQVSLQAQEIKLRRDVDFQGKEGWSNDYLVNFSDSSMIEWETRFVTDAEFNILLQLSSQQGSEITIQIDSSKITRVIDNPMLKDIVPSQDRVKRGEVYGYIWSTLDFGNLHINKGIRTVKVLVKNPKDLEIKSLQLLKNE